MKEYGSGAYPYLTAEYAHPEFGYGPIGGGAGYYDILDPAVVAANHPMHIVTTGPEFLSALAASVSGDYVYVANDILLYQADIPYYKPYANNSGLDVPNGVTLFGTRGAYGVDPGPRIIMADRNHAISYGPTLLNLFDDVRVTGLRFEGPDPNTYMGGGRTGPDYMHYWSAMWGYGDNVRIDNCEVYGWLNLAINAYKRMKVHHCNIHHNAGETEGYGIGIQASSAGVDIVACYFDFCRHCVSGGGTSVASIYHAYYNIFGANCPSQTQIDLHGGNDPQLLKNRAVGDTTFSNGTITVAGLVEGDVKNNFYKFQVGDRLYTTSPNNYGPFTIISRTGNTVTVSGAMVNETPGQLTSVTPFVTFCSPDINAGDEIEVAWNDILTVSNEPNGQPFSVRGFPKTGIRIHHNWIRQANYPLETYSILQTCGRVGGTSPNYWKTGSEAVRAAAKIQANYHDEEGENPNWVNASPPPDIVYTGTLSISTNPLQPNGVQCYLDDGSGPVAVGSTSVMSPLDITVEAYRQYILTVDPISGYATPPPVTVSVNKDEVLDVVVDYSAVPVGTLYVNTTPVSGIIQVDGVTRGVGSATINVPAGPHVISFLPVTGWATPDPWGVTVIAGNAYSHTATYSLVGGLLSISITGASEAEISVDGQAIGTVAQGTPIQYAVDPGAHTVTFGAVSGYIAPGSQQVTIGAGETREITGAYQAQGGGGTGSGSNTKVIVLGAAALISIAVIMAKSGRRSS